MNKFVKKTLVLSTSAASMLSSFAGVAAPAMNTVAHADYEKADKTQLNSAINKAEAISFSSPTYKDETQANKDTFNKMLSAAQDLENREYATQAQVDLATQALNKAVDQLNENAETRTQHKKDADARSQQSFTIEPTVKALQDAVDKAQNLIDSKSPQYTGAMPDKKATFDNALQNGKDSLQNWNDNKKDMSAEQANKLAQQMKDRTKALQDAQEALNDGNTAQARAALEAALQNAAGIKNSDRYTKAPKDAQKAFDDAVKKGQTDDKDPYATNNVLNGDTQGINDAIAGLDTGSKNQQVAKQALEKALEQAKGLKDQDAYKKASPEAQQKFDDAISNGEKVDGDPNATTGDVTDAINKLHDAEDLINGPDSANKKPLKDELTKAEAMKNTDKYTKATPAEQKALDDAISHGKSVLNDPLAKDSDITDAINGLKGAEDALTGEAEKQAVAKKLRDAIDKANQDKETNNYKHADPDKKSALDDAIKNAQDDLGDPDTSKNNLQRDLDDLTKADNDLNGDKNDQDFAAAKKALQAEVDKAEPMKTTPPYQFATATPKKAFDDALSNAKNSLTDPNATTDQLKHNLTSLQSAESGLDGVIPKVDTTPFQKDLDSYKDSAAAKDLPEMGESTSALAAAGVAMASLVTMAGSAWVMRKKRSLR